MESYYKSRNAGENALSPIKAYMCVSSCVNKD